MKSRPVTILLLLSAVGCARIMGAGPETDSAREIVSCDASECGIADPARLLLAAGGGRPSTGYPGVAVSIAIPTSSDVTGGWSADVNYTHNLAESFAIELSLGTSAFEVEGGTLTGDLRSLELGAICQTGKSFGSSRWYVGAGLGYMMNDLTGLGGVTADDSLSVAVVGGLDVPLSTNGAICFELRYRTAMTSLSVGDDLDVSAIATRINYVFLF